MWVEKTQKKVEILQKDIYFLLQFDYLHYLCRKFAKIHNMAQGLTKIKYPVGIQTFEKIREGGYIYVDKTDFVYQLASEGCFYFLSRPRRFGKSLLISTFKAYFSGKKELFEGLAIDKLEKDWTACPVLHIDLNSGLYSSVENLRNTLAIHLNGWEKTYGVGKDERDPGERFAGVIERAYEKTGQKIVILVDEYDKPLLQNIDNKELQEDIRKEMKAFFSQIKSKDEFIRFGFFTGVTKFSKVSIFSDLNNLTDISLNKQYERICGISKQELTDVFKQGIQEMAEDYQVDYDTMLTKLQEKYDGYHFSEGMTDIFNPFSVLNALRGQKLGDFWFESGTPTFLIKLIRNNRQKLEKLETIEMKERDLMNVGNMLDCPISMLFLNGFLTIKDYDREDDLYSLKIPNQEVRDIIEQEENTKS